MREDSIEALNNAGSPSLPGRLRRVLKAAILESGSSQRLKGHMPSPLRLYDLQSPIARAWLG
jgi:hypothetical protein